MKFSTKELIQLAIDEAKTSDKGTAKNFYRKLLGQSQIAPLE
jgi:hypothetical protein